LKLLFDENFPRKALTDLPGHSITTVQALGWTGKKNGELLELMLAHGFDGLITLDQNLPKQQNLSRFAIKVYLLKPVDSRPSTVAALLPLLRSALNTHSKDQVVGIE